MSTLTPLTSTTAGLAPETYIYKILSNAPRTSPHTYTTSPTRLAIISSDDSLRFLDPSTFSLIPDGVIGKAHESITCLERADDEGSLIATAGRDGLVKYWDARVGGKGGPVMCITNPDKLISTLTTSYPHHLLATGLENPNDGPSDSPIHIFDLRSPSVPTLSLLDSHTDTITTLSLHPSHPSLLLSSSTDNLLSIFDTSQPTEDDALYQVINHGSAVAHAGFVYPSTDIYALGTDETLSFYALQSVKEEEAEPEPRRLGDVRGVLGVEYVVDVVGVGGRWGVVGGRTSGQKLDIIPLRKNEQTKEPLAYECDLDAKVAIPGAHGEEIVRDLFVDVHSNTTFTVGEDGHVRAWKMPGSASIPMDEDVEIKDAKNSGDKERRERKKERREKREKKKADKEKARFKPY
ncbi:WD40 repeat-like protein [Sporormia fimetaria CBS 119925]|uniref:WD40 repeat-like protein n=1 Tax=Sporormia fimetaria CBS 119925 TaxID=1340428 RepID=A0A6A6V9D6_9PLEO|nr:WD40 repeat-like protein [Sporormia fimetaria CBS 119925]